MLNKGNSLGSFLTILAVMFFAFGCAEKSGSLSDSIFSALGIPTDNGGSMPANASLTPYKDTDQPATLPVDFGNGGPQAILNLATYDSVDRYKSLEIVFSEPMNQSTVRPNFSLKKKSGSSWVALPGPTSIGVEDNTSNNRGGSFYWKSGGRLVFDPYRELEPSTTYQLSLTASAQGLEGGNLTPYTIEFTTEPDYLVNVTLNGTALGTGMTTVTNGKLPDITFIDSNVGTASNIALNLTASLSSDINASNISSIKLKHMGNNMGATGEYTVCSSTGAPTCSSISGTSLLTNFNLNTQVGTPAMGGGPSEDQRGLKAFNGGNSYLFEITTTSGKVFRRPFGFNYGKVNNKPYDALVNAAATVADQAQTLKLFAQVLERLTKNDYKVSSKSFWDFSNLPPQSTKRTAYCVDYANITYIRNYGDAQDNVPGYNPATDKPDGYCGGAGDQPGGFVTDTISAKVLGLVTVSSIFDVDAYITSVQIDPTVTVSSTAYQNVTATLGVNANNDLGVTLGGRKVVIGMSMIARNRSALKALGLGPDAGSKFYYTTTAELNYSDSSKTIRNATAHADASVDANGNVVVKINEAKGAFDTSAWANNLKVNTPVRQSYDATGGTPDWLIDIILPLVEGELVSKLTAQLTPKITKAMLSDFIEGIAPTALNAVVNSLYNPGLDVTLPSYLPAPLANFPLSLKLKFQTDVVPKLNGSNKGLVGSATVGLIAKNPIATTNNCASGNTSYHCHKTGTGLLGSDAAAGSTKGGYVSGRPVAVPDNQGLTSTYAFNNSAANPGLLLTLTADTVSQAAYSLWQNGTLNLTLNKPFIDTIKAYAGDDPLFQLTQELVKVGTLLNVVAPGRNTLVGLDPANSSQLIQNVNSTDDVDIDIWAIHAPNGKLKFVGSAAQIPTLEVNFTELQLSIYGRRPDNSRYLLSTVRISLKGDGNFRFIPFDNSKSGNPAYNNLNALSLVIKKEETNMQYTMDILEGAQYNPFGLDPKGIFQVVDPLVRSLIIPLVNNVLRQIPLPSQLSVAAITNNAGAANSCYLKATTDALKIFSTTIPANEPYPYIFGGLQFQGAYATNPGNAIVCN
ncbi:Ig-like protein [Leptospira wolffii]|uniref:Ig-like protein n=1 Tax=Leptospira wolffii TaxID=409998 RepID=A0A2M9Z865_9LEPT|nr:Ig-like domain-containing protein [Leptospira wolffii]PJZ64619.1 Ig-like protein [Leptospira wolffii]